MAQHAVCNSCGFEFYGGHSHHTGCSQCVCLHCLSHFECPTRSPWGPAIGETIQLFRVETTGKGKKRRIRRVPTEARFVTTQGESTQIGDQTFFNVHYPIEEEVACPTCGEFKLCQGFELNSECPSCKSDPLSISAIEY